VRFEELVARTKCGADAATIQGLQGSDDTAQTGLSRSIGAANGAATLSVRAGLVTETAALGHAEGSASL
jgi:hypothetical protein